MRLHLVTSHHPDDSTAAARRIGQLQRQLDLHGFDTQLLVVKEREKVDPPRLAGTTRKPARKVRHIVRQLLRATTPYFRWPDAQRSSIPKVIRSLKQRARPGDIVLISAPPFSLAVAGLLAQRVCGVSTVLDLRDLWAGNPHARLPAGRYLLDRPAERLCVRSADLVLANTPACLEILRRRDPGANLKLLMNGVDPSRINTATDAQNERFEILYTGQFYGDRRDPTELLRALSDMRSDGLQIHLTFLGWQHPTAPALIARLGLTDVVAFEERVDLPELTRRQQRANILLLLAAPDDNGIAIPSKVYEYLAARRPILSLGPPQPPWAAWLHPTIDACLLPHDKAGIISYLRREHDRQWTKGDLKPVADVRPNPPQWTELGDELASSMDELAL